MAVSTVKLEGDAFMVCLIHALSTEREEVMGLLIGEVDNDNGVTHIYSVIMLQRLDKRKDRVEISPEQLSDASDQAERLGKLTKGKKPMRVVGWYHSHPHITVWPSHVDLRTQAMYQVMDKGFVGLIFSCFNDDTKSNGQLKVICFQSVDVNKNTCNEPPQEPLGSEMLCGNDSKTKFQKEEIELQIVPTVTLSEANLDRLTELPQILAKEEEGAYERVMRAADLITCIHNGTVFTKALCQLTEVICGPLLQVLENRLELNKRRALELEQEKERLTKELKEITTENLL